MGIRNESLRAKMKGKEDWKKIYEKSNSVELLKMIKDILFKDNTKKQLHDDMEGEKEER